MPSCGVLWFREDGGSGHFGSAQRFQFELSIVYLYFKFQNFKIAFCGSKNGGAAILFSPNTTVFEILVFDNYLPVVQILLKSVPVRLKYTSYIPVYETCSNTSSKMIGDTKYK